MKKALLIIAILFSYLNTYAQLTPSIVNISCVPANPTTNDTITFYVDVVFLSSSCNLFVSNHSTSGSTIVASAQHCVGMAAAICNTTDTFVVPPLSAGTYIFDMTLSSGFGGPPCTPGIVADDNQLFTFIVSAAPPPCTLTGGVVTVPYSAPPIMMNATVNGMSQYAYAWTNGATTNQNQFYSGWCVTITDLQTGCDTNICESCIPTTAIGPCPMIYAPVCGCDGNIYNNDCLAMRSGIFTYTNAIGPSGQLLPCPQNPVCTVEINNGATVIEMCDGDTVILEANIGFDTYIWTISGPPIGSARIITTTTPGVYTVVATDSVCVAIDSIEVILYQTPTLSIYAAPNPPYICSGDSIVLEATAGFVIYAWNNGMTGDRIVDFPGQDTWYLLEAVDSNGCVVLQDIWVYVDTCTSSINNLSFQQIAIYPNPTNGKVNIKIPKGEIFNFSLFDLQGKIILKKEKIHDNFIFDTKEIGKGTYLINLESVKGKYSRKILIE